MICLDSRDARPIYEQVMDSLRRLVVSGAIQPGEKLPSVRAMATALARSSGPMSPWLRRGISIRWQARAVLQLTGAISRAGAGKPF